MQKQGLLIASVGSLLHSLYFRLAHELSKFDLRLSWFVIKQSPQRYLLTMYRYLVVQFLKATFENDHSNPFFNFASKGFNWRPEIRTRI